ERLQRHEAGRHAVLRVEVLVPREDADVAERRSGNGTVSGLEVEAAQRAGDVRVDAGGAFDRVVQLAGVSDRRIRELPAQLEPVPGEADVGLGHGDRHVESGAELEARASRPEAGAGREAADADVLETAGGGRAADVRVGAPLASFADPLV